MYTKPNPDREPGMLRALVENIWPTGTDACLACIHIEHTCQLRKATS